MENTTENKAPAMLDLTKLIRPDSQPLTAWVEYKYGIALKFTFVSRSRMQDLYKSCTDNRYNPLKKVREPQVDPKKFSEEFCKLAVTDWRGVTVDSLANILPLVSVPEEQRKVEIPFSQEQLFALLQAAYELDVFVQDTAVNAQVFSPYLEEELKNS